MFSSVLALAVSVGMASADPGPSASVQVQARAVKPVVGAIWLGPAVLDPRAAVLDPKILLPVGGTVLAPGFVRTVAPAPCQERSPGLPANANGCMRVIEAPRS